MDKRKYAPAADLKKVMEKFRQDLAAFRRTNGMTEGEASAALGCHRLFMSYMRRGVQEPKLSTIVEVYDRLNSYKAKS